MNEVLKKIGVHIPEIMLPADVDMEKWSVVACDQYTSEPEYWEKVEQIVGDSPSTLKLVFPEVYLEGNDRQERIDNINTKMKCYLDNSVLSRQEKGFIFVDRKTCHAESRKGLIIAVDLEAYDYNKGSQTLIRATEDTVIERLPPRIKIRENAELELPHIMLLIDDPGKTVIEPLSKQTEKMEILYDFDLMIDGGHIKGYKVEGKMLQNVIDALSLLSQRDDFENKYSVGKDKKTLLFAVGDGNHSLASAKGHWENVKKTLTSQQIENHPARFALVEVVNVHDEGLVFEPIHRVVFNADSHDILKGMVNFYKKHGIDVSIEYESTNNNRDKDVHYIPFISKELKGVIKVYNPKFNLEVGTLQYYLDQYLKDNVNVKIDYIHGDNVVERLGTMPGNIGFYLPPMDKNDLFKTVILDGALPRKTFSMGEASEKRFYLESRKIK